jgi:hypothetical protein
MRHGGFVGGREAVVRFDPFTTSEQSGMWNIVIGAIMVVGGLSGKLALKGTNSSGALAAVGAGLIVWGIVQVARAKSA